MRAPRTSWLEDAAFGLLACSLALGAPAVVRLLGLHPAAPDPPLGGYASVFMPTANEGAPGGGTGVTPPKTPKA